jgi:hypothetical protein
MNTEAMMPQAVEIVKLTPVRISNRRREVRTGSGSDWVFLSLDRNFPRLPPVVIGQIIALPIDYIIYRLAQTL